MKEMRMKIAKVLARVYGTGIVAALFGGALSAVGYIVAIAVGGQAAEEICVFIYKQVYPVLFYISSASVFVGLVKMYVAGEKAMTPTKKSNQNNKENKTS